MKNNYDNDMVMNRIEYMDSMIKATMTSGKSCGSICQLLTQIRAVRKRLIEIENKINSEK